MNEQHFAIAEQVARQLTVSSVDPNELAKVTIYARLHPSRDLFRFLETLVNRGDLLVRSGRTLGYYRDIQRVCQTYLRDYIDQPQEVARILGWSVRLMRYYNVVGLEERAPKPPRRPSERPSRPPAPTGPIPKRPQDLKRDMVLQGVVKRIMPYGAFVDIGVRRDGLLHISELSERRVAAVTDVVREGDRITVRVKKVERRGGKFRISLSMKGVPQE